ncbi:Hypothetical predicted protein [Prunus dulcis]|uniref:Uncharacterized protein n=1 Tax=Prunus dulcis TaxID=3755 RepID=A0A5E4ELM0_PRUDU|nr:Hypothetical predicted protein [Prunus dulcis]
MRDEPEDMRVEEGEVESIRDMLVQMPWEQGAYVSSHGKIGLGCLGGSRRAWAGDASLLFSTQPVAATASYPLIRERGDTMKVERDGR